MGFWGDIVGTVKDFFGTKNENTNNNNDTSVQTIYEPDRVRIEELQKENNQMMIEAQKDIIQMNGQMQSLIIQAQVKGFEYSSNILKDMLSNLNKIAQERMILIENGHFEVVERIEKLYMSLEKEIRTDNTNFNLNDLPQMMEMLEKFDKNSSSHELYKKSVDGQIQMNMEFVNKKISALHERQKMMVASSINTKELVLEQSSKIVEDRMKFLEKNLENNKNQQNSLDFKKNSQDLLENKE